VASATPTGSPRLDAVFGALADATRRQIVARLAGGTASTRALAAPFAMSLPAVSKHLTVLERAGLIERRLVGRERQCRLIVAALVDAMTWIDAQRGFWEFHLDRLTAFVQQTTQETPAWQTSRTAPTAASPSAGRSRPRATSSSRPGRRPRR
jgi:DNA-binding transcriptional ArsR family regulator